MALNETYRARRLTRGELASCTTVRPSLLMTFTWRDGERNAASRKANQMLETHPCSGNGAAAVTAPRQPKGREKQREAQQWQGRGGKKKGKKKKKSIVTAFGERMKMGCNRQSRRCNRCNCSAIAYPAPAICSRPAPANVCIQPLHPSARQRPCPPRPRSRALPAEGHRCQPAGD